MQKRYFFGVIFLISLSVSGEFGKAPQNWGDIKFGLVSNGVRVGLSGSQDTERLKKATEELGIKIDYRYRYVNEGVDPAKNSCSNLFPKMWDYNYSDDAKKDAGVESSYVIYVLQEEKGREGLLATINDPDKARKFFHTLKIVAENANGYGATIVVEPDTWGYFLQHAWSNNQYVAEIDPRKIPAVVNNIPDSTYGDTVFVIPDPAKPWEKKMETSIHPLSFDYLSDLPNNMSGFARAIVRTLHKYAPDCYVGFLASHWSVQMNLDGAGWNADGMVWATDALLDTSAIINIEFFDRLHYGSVSESSPLLPGDSPDFIGMEKNGWCAGTWETTKNFMFWYWDDPAMRNYLRWVKMIAQGLDLPVVGWQISIGNMDNPNTMDEVNMANAFKDTFFPYFFKHVDEFVDAGFIGFLVGKGLMQGTDYVLPGETVGEQGWFLSQLREFDKQRPYLDTTLESPISVQEGEKISPANMLVRSVGKNLSLSLSNDVYGQSLAVTIYDLRGRIVSRSTHLAKSSVSISTAQLSAGSYVMRAHLRNQSFLHQFIVR